MSELKALRNPKDPLHNSYEGPKELFERFAKACNGFPHEFVIDAAGRPILGGRARSRALTRP
jgi:hypothetical protein